MPILNYTTSVPVEKTVAEIERMLSEHKAQKILKEYDEQGNLNQLSFMIQTPQGSIPIRLPVRLDAVMKTINKQTGEYKRMRYGQVRKVPRKFLNDKEQAGRVGWRILKDWLEAQLAVNELEMVKIEEIFLPYIVGNDGRTLFEHIEKSGFKGYLLDAPKEGDAVLGEEGERKCFNCNKKLEKWLDNNKDADGNEYCADCVAKVELVAEQQEEDE